MNIYNIKTINSGLKGLEVSFTEERKESNGRKFVDDITKEKNDPIHLALDKPIKQLRRYLLEICGIINDETSEAEGDQAVAETDIISIRMTKTLFIIEGEKEWLNDKHFKLKTPKIELKDNYVNYDAVMEILSDIKTEAEVYMRGTAKVSEEEIAIRWLSSSKNKTGQTPDNFNSMSTEEKAQFCKEWLENEVGGMVTLQEDTLPVDESETPEIEEDEIDLSNVEKEETF